ncbi:protein PTHB1 [Nymphalis io]|uniref:protein PTHB1 n=1 Tax=Inachis io TaxID=171585 RepID=UPI002168A8B5|nr:protein PTHB1 [Nymphalis io]
MSLFKVKQWWSNEKSLSEVCDEGTQNGKCIKVDRFNSHSDSDCLIVGQGSLMKIYKPNSENDDSHSILESQLKDVVLQIETGKFIADSPDRQILILHSKSYAIYTLERTRGQIDVGEQNVLSPVISHLFTRRAFSTTCGPFGYSKRDLICIQALDGTLSFFDQDTFLFMCVFNDILIPGLVHFIPNSDQFIICKSTWIMEIYSYQQLGELSELSTRPNRKNINIPQWIYNAGEEIISIQVIRTSNSFSSIVAVGERHLYCFQDNGLMKFMIRFDYMPICFHAYLIGWYYEPNSRLLVMVASEDSKLYIYEGTSLLWSCDLTHRPISIARCYLNALPGGIVTLSTKGIIHVSFLGTEPDLNANGKPMNDMVDPDQIQDELDSVENSLQKVMDARKEFDDENEEGDQIVNIKVEIGTPNDDPISNYPPNNIETLQTCSMVVILSCVNPSSIQSIQITYDCVPPIACSDTALCFENVNGTKIIETQVYISNEADISDCGINIVISAVDIKGKIKIMSKRVLLPLKLYCVPVDNVVENNFKLSFKTNQPCLDLSEIFTEFTKEDLASTIKNNLTFKYRTSNKTVTVKADDDLYAIETNELSIMSPIFEYFVNNLKKHYARAGVTDFKIHFNLDEELIKVVLHTFLKSIENHAKERIKTKSLEYDLNVLQRQFTLVQKRLLVQYGSLPPGNCDGLEFLMNDTHERIKTVAYGIMQSKRYVFSAGNILRRIGSIIIYILKEKLNDDFKVKLVEEMLSLNTLNDQFQEWEEHVAQGLSYILNKVFKKSEKDKEKLAPVTDQDILSQTNLKKFLKQIRIIFEKLLIDCQDTSEIKNNVIRTEEFVEVI